MSMFYCHACDELRDADDGCEEAPDGLNLICADCMADAEAEEDALPTGNAPQDEGQRPSALLATDDLQASLSASLSREEKLRGALVLAEYAIGNFVKPTSPRDVGDLVMWAEEMFLPEAREALGSPAPQGIEDEG